MPPILQVDRRCVDEFGGGDTIKPCLFDTGASRLGLIGILHATPQQLRRIAERREIGFGRGVDPAQCVIGGLPIIRQVTGERGVQSGDTEERISLDPDIARSVGVGGVSSVDALIALQDVGGPLERRRRAVGRAGRILDVLDEVKVAIVPGEGFGAPGYARLSYALGDDDLIEGVTRIAELLG